ncbi:DUF4012 domain-containing protein [Pseudarthrobacter sulfonivorans]|uniref:DUF4012 domain-containing protein n=1 Tax=Pseudarthrobacter sulfonivorans TaxID=121292 RepID=UPI00278038F5|nr:DUF4012 domain-containing protein [Pseudarthrobacter sulfonivorans]MDQ0000842.1 hypothetical protein [Pseudarthrobacter sulfonivorans]
MAKDIDISVSAGRNEVSDRPPRQFRRRRLVLGVSLITSLILLGGASAWLGMKAASLQKELQAAVELIPALKDDITANRLDDANAKVASLRVHTSSAREAASDPLWTMASSLPWLGPNFSAAAEVSRSADDVATLAVSPLVSAFETLKWNSLMPTTEGADLEPLRAAAPRVTAAAYAVSNSADRLDSIDADLLIPQLAGALNNARDQLAEVRSALDVAASVSEIAPEMLGAEGPRRYLLLVQNNAELRATGGIPASVAILTVDKGKLSMTSQTTAEAMGTMSPILDVEPQQEQIYSARLGRFMQDVNLTPDFPTAAALAANMWERKYGERVDGVVSIDPVALSFLLEATGPMNLDSDLLALSGNSMPSELTTSNVVKTLLSDVYAQIPTPAVQDIYFAGVAKQIFDSLSSSSSEPEKLLAGLTRGSNEGRILVWSVNAEEQKTIARYPLGGSVSGASVAPAQFGVYFNDGTGAKMDYYVRRTVQLVKECSQNGYEQTTVRVTSKNTAPADAERSLPLYVTGDGQFGVPAGSVQTNIAAYGPVQANVETAKLDGERTSFAPYVHNTRPVGVVAIRLAPGESRTVDFTFGKIVQHTEPNVVVTPTVEDVKDVILPTEIASCG